MADAFSPGLPADAVRARRLEMLLALVEQLLQDARGPQGPPGPPGSGGGGGGASLPADVAYTDVANTFTVGPQTVIPALDAQAGLVLQNHSLTTSAPLFQARDSSGNTFARITDKIAGSSVRLARLTMGDVAAFDGIGADAVLGFGIYSGSFIGNVLQVYDFDTSQQVLLVKPDGSIISRTSLSLGGTDSGRYSVTQFSGGGYFGIRHHVYNMDDTMFDNLPGVIRARANDSVGEVNVGAVSFNFSDSTDATYQGQLALIAYDYAGAREGFRVDSTGSAAAIGFFGTSAVVKQASAANLTNNVTSGGTSDQIDDFTNLTVYATDAAAIRNDIYQLARKVKQINDALRLYGLLT